MVNCLGATLAGALLSSGILFTNTAYSKPLEALLLVGFLGGMTTFSSFSLDGYRLIAQDKVMSAIIYSIGTPLCALSGFALIFLINGGSLN